MMAFGSHKFSVVLISFIFVLFQVSLTYPTASNQTEGQVTPPLVKVQHRFRRAACLDGIYEINGRNCCRCSAGQMVLKHCSKTPDDRICMPCPDRTYSSVPNGQGTCLPCTSCVHPNANLEVADPCTSARDAKCQCKKGYYCNSGSEPCTVCQPCKECGAEGVRVACTSTSNTVCSDRTEGTGENVGLIVGIVVVIIIILGLAASAFLYWKFRRTRPSDVNDNAVAEPLQPLTGTHLPDLARKLGWKEMRDIALRSGMSITDIDNYQRNHPNDTLEQTLQLLNDWMERQGKDASEKLIELLHKSGNKKKVEEVKAILHKDA